MYSLFMDHKFYINNKFLPTMKEMKRMSLFYSVNMYDLLLLVSGGYSTGNTIESRMNIRRNNAKHKKGNAPDTGTQPKQSKGKYRKPNNQSQRNIKLMYFKGCSKE